MTNFNPKVSDLKKFLEEKKYGFDLTLIEFSHFYDFAHALNTEDMEKLSNPGVYGIHCLATNRTFITYSVCVLGEMQSDLVKLQEKAFQEPTDLENDFAKYREAPFVFIFLTLYPELKDFKDFSEIMKKCGGEVARIKSMWPYQLY